MANIKKLIQRTIEHCGYGIYNIEGTERLGWNWLRDAKRLSELFGYPIDVVFDVGANIGQTGVEIRSVIPDATIYSFEPVPATFKKLEVNKFRDRHHVYNFAFGAETTQQEMWSFGCELTNSFIENGLTFRRGDREKTLVGELSVRRLDDFCTAEGIEEISILKIDTEGYEMKVLEGAEEIISRGSVKIIYAEYNGASEHCENGLISLSNYLVDRGYRFVSTYVDGITKTLPLYTISNALFVLDKENSK